MKKYFLLFLYFPFTLYCYQPVKLQANLSSLPQGKRVFSAKVENNTLTVSDTSGLQIYSHKFSNPSIFQDTEVDFPGVFILFDSSIVNNKPSYELYIYCMIDSFYVIDSLNSGTSEPYPAYSEEIDSSVLITGNSELDSLNNEEPDFLPINCWKIENNEIFSVNEDVYNIYIDENESILDFLDQFYNSNFKNCNSSEKVKSAIASVYINYLNAGEKSIASKFIKTYYLCSDIELFIKKLNILAKSEDN